MDRFLDDSENVAEVEVEAFQPETADMLTHKLDSVVDIDRIDFFFPLAFLCFIFLLKYFGLVGNIVALMLQFVLLLDLMRRINRRPSGRRVVGLTLPFRGQDWFRALLLYIIALPFIVGAGWLNYTVYRMIFPEFSLFGSSGTAVVLFDGMGAFIFRPEVIIELVMGVVFAPLTEEIWFRGIGLAGFINRTGSRTKALVWTSVIFGLLHGSLRFMLTGVMGVVLALIRFRTGSLYCCIAIHALHNFLVLAIATYFS